MAVALGPGNLVGVRILINDPFAERQNGVVHRDVDELPLTGFVGTIHRGHQSERRERSGQGIAHAGSDLRRRTLRSGDAHHAAHRLRDDVVRRPVHVGALAGARIAETTDRRIDELRVDLVQRLVTEPELVHHAGAIVLDEYVGGAHQPADRLFALGTLQIDADGSLAAVDALEIGAVRRMATGFGRETVPYGAYRRRRPVPP